MADDNTFDPKSLKEAVRAQAELEAGFQRVSTAAEKAAIVNVKFADAMKDAHDAASDIFNVMQSSGETQQTILAQKQEELMWDQHALDIKIQGETLTAQEVSDQQSILDSRAGQLRMLQSMGPLNQQSLGALGQQVNHTEELADKSAEHAANVKRSKDSMKGSLTMATGISESWKSTGAGAFYSTMQTEGFAGAISQAGAAASELFTWSNMIGSALVGLGAKLMQMVFALDGAQASFNKTTGAAGKYNELIERNYQSSIEMGGSLEDVTGAIQELRNGYTDWSKMSEDQQSSLVNLGVAMNQMGVSQEQYAQSMENATQIMGMTNTEAQEFQGTMFGLAEHLDMDFSKVMQNLNQHMDSFAASGANAGKEFMAMQAIAKKTGIEMGVLLQMVEQYDTIAGSAAATAKLNAALGGQFLNASSMMTKSLSERVIAIRGAIDASGKDFKSMTRQQRQYYANAIGIKNVAAATKMFGDMTAEEMSKVAREAEEAGMSIEEMMEKTKHSQTAGAKFNAMLASLAELAAPIVELIHMIANGLLWIKESLGGGWWGTIAMIGTAFLTWRLIPTLLKPIGGQLKNIAEITTKKFPKATGAMKDMFGKKTQENAKKSGKSFATTIKKIGKAASKNVKGLLTLGAVFIMIGIGIGIIVYSLSLLAEQMKDMSGGAIAAFALVILAIAAAIWIMIPAIFGLAPASTVAAKPMLLFGAAMLLVGAGVALAGLGLYLFAQAFLAVAGDIGTFALFVGLMAVLAIAAFALGIGGVVAMYGLIAMSLGLMALAFSLFWISTDDLEALGQMMSGLGEVSKHAGSGMGEAVPQVKSLMHALLGMSWLIEESDMIENIDTMGKGFMAMGISASTAVEPISALASPMQMIAAAMGVWAENMAKLMTNFPSFVLLMGGLALALLGVGWAFFGIMALSYLFWSLADSISSIPDNKVVAFKEVFETIEDAAPVMEKITPTVVDNVSDLVNQAHEYNFATRGGLFSGMDRFAEMLGLAGNASNRSATTGANAAPTTVILELDKHELGRTVAKLVNKKYKVKQSTT